MSDTGTAYEAQCDILADLWVEYKSEPEFKDFVEYNDLGLPLAYSIANGIVANTELAKSFIEETFVTLLGVLKIEDTGFDSLADVFIAAQR